MSALELERELVALVATTAHDESAASGEFNRIRTDPGRAERAWVTAEQDGGDAEAAEQRYDEAVRALKRAQVKQEARHRAHVAAVEELKQHRKDHVAALLAPREELTARASASLAAAVRALAQARSDWTATAAAWGQLKDGLRAQAMATGTDPAEQTLRVPEFPLKFDARMPSDDPNARVPRPPLLSPGEVTAGTVEATLDMAGAAQAGEQ